MKLTAFFKGATIVLAITLTQMAVAFEPSTFTKKGEWTGNIRRIGHALPDSLLRHETTVKPTLLMAQQSRTHRIQFAPGAVSDVVEDSVVRGTREIYLLRARRGQTMTLNITSVDQNAVFDVQSPNGTFLREQASNWSGTLPSTGDYSVIVSATRGNASYKLEVTIQ